MSADQQPAINPQATQEEIHQVFQLQKKNSQLVMRRSAGERIKQLRRIEKWIDRHADDIKQAIYQDFRKPGPETDITEIYLVQTEIRHTVSKLKKWMKPKTAKTPWSLTGTKSYVYREPKGVCLIIAPWNFPFQLMIMPLVSAIAAGNCAMLKPSELTPHTARLISHMIATLFKPEEVAVFEGDQEVAQSLLKLPFDHIFFTGSPAIGKLVMKSAAENLSSVTLELGGKSPAIIDASAKLQDAAEKIAWGKWLNCGQTCIAPDYLLVDEQIEKEFCVELQKAAARLFQGKDKDIRSSADYARIVNARHFNRLKELLADGLEKGGTLLMGGETRAEDNYMAPTVLREVPEESRIWEEEIFGPLLPIKTYSRLEDAVQYIRERPKPLSLYLFSSHTKNQQYILSETSSGSVCMNDCLLQYIQPGLPFGGVNTSGIGKAHGKWGFMAFSNEKSVTEQRIGLTSIKPVYPPYTKKTKKLIALFMKYM